VKREEVSDITFAIGKGCEECAHTGYKGRMGIFEFLIVTDPVRDLILERASADEINRLAIEQGMQTMRQDGWIKICMGLTTFEEVTRQTPWDERGKSGTVVEPAPVIPKAAAVPKVAQGPKHEAISPPPVERKQIELQPEAVPPWDGEEATFEPQR